MHHGYISPFNDTLVEENNLLPTGWEHPILVTFSEIPLVESDTNSDDDLICLKDETITFGPHSTEVNDMSDPHINSQSSMKSRSNQTSDYDSEDINNKGNVSRKSDITMLLPLHPYTFNHDIYRSSTMSLPHNILRIIPETKSKKAHDISVRYHMPHWKYFEFTTSQQKDFIAKYFPERMGLYKTYTREEEKNHLFIYLWLYMNGGIYIGPDYELLKSLEQLLDEFTDSNPADLYFMFDNERYISPNFLASQPFCGFWIEVINLMDKRRKYKYPSIQEEIDRNTGRGILTDITNETRYKFEIIPRSELDPYTPCDTNFNKDTYLCPTNRTQTFMTYVSCQTGSSTEMLYITGAIILVIAIMVIIALITN